MKTRFETVLGRTETVYSGVLYWLNMQGLNRTDFDNEYHRRAYEAVHQLGKLAGGGRAVHTLLGKRADKSSESVEAFDERFGSLTAEFTRAIDAYESNRKQKSERDQRLRELFQQTGLDPTYIS